jgi:TPR repeat protein
MRLSTDDASARKRCFALAGATNAKAVDELAQRCSAKRPNACALLGNLRRGSKLLQWQPQLWSVPCGTRGRGCARLVEVKVPFELGDASQRDAGAAERAFVTACKAGHHDACLELSDLVRQDDTARSDDLRRGVCLGGDVHACASAVFRWLRSGGLLEDPEACNNLAFVQLRGAGGASDPKAAAASFARSCELGASHGCANLLFLAEAKRKLSRGLKLEAASKAVATVCEDGGAIPYECMAHALAQLRGFGTKRDTRAGGKRMRALCKDGLDEACRVR